jgi:16S rRNA (cytidine1402-2'-O)-methyltransferase
MWFEIVKARGPLVVFYEAPHRIRRTLEELQAVVGDCHVTVGRELTKKHEELVRGPISQVLAHLAEPLGEFTVVANIGQITENIKPEPPADADILIEFGESTKNRQSSKRKTLALLAAKYRMTPNDVYAALERAKKLVE